MAFRGTEFSCLFHVKSIRTLQT